MRVVCSSKDAYKLVHEGSLAMADLQCNGIRIDTSYVKNEIKRLDKDIEVRTKALSRYKEAKLWKKVYGSSANYDSGPQLIRMLFGEMGHQPRKYTNGKYYEQMDNKERAKATPSTDQESLEALNIPFINDYLYIKKLKKVQNTYLRKIYRETVDGFIHPGFSLFLTRTHRSSSSDPNFQNMPIRDKEMGGIVRKAFIPRKGRRLVGADYGGVEVRASAWYHKDPEMLNYLALLDKADMHRDVACDLFFLKPDSKGKLPENVRFVAKNSFVFAQFYGDYWGQIARTIWDDIDKLQLKNFKGEPLKKHLQRHGIKDFGDFQEHVKAVEKRFWKKFRRYAAWKKAHYNQYLRDGYVESLTGFRYVGHMEKNQVNNYPIQGTAFQCLLKSLIDINKELKRGKWNTKLVGQIHDEVVSDVDPAEEEDYQAMTFEIMSKGLKEAWPFVITNLEVEYEYFGVDGNWFGDNGKPEKSVKLIG